MEARPALDLGRWLKAPARLSKVLALAFDLGAFAKIGHPGAGRNGEPVGQRAEALV